jgi:hypothetical protein
MAPETDLSIPDWERQITTAGGLEPTTVRGLEPKGIVAEPSVCELFLPTVIREFAREAHLGDKWLGCVGGFVEVLPEDFDLLWVVFVSAFVPMS